MNLLTDFKSFAIKGNVVDLAVGVIIGAAFGKIVTSVVDDVIMPVAGIITGKVNFTDKFLSLDGRQYSSLKAARDQGGAVVAYGNLINTVVHFTIIAFCVFLMVQAIKKLRQDEIVNAAPAEPPAPTAEEKLLTEIRDLLKSNSK